MRGADVCTARTKSGVKSLSRSVILCAYPLNRLLVSLSSVASSLNFEVTLKNLNHSTLEVKFKIK